MSSRKVLTPVLVLGLSLGTLSYLHALPLQGERGEVRIQQEISNRSFIQDLMQIVYDFMEANHPPVADEGPGLCPNGKPPGRQGGTGSGSGNGNSNGNGW